MSSSALLLENVAFRYGNRVALSEVSLRVEPGQVFGLLGPNGSGKSTLFKLISTILPPQAGQMSIFGLDVATQADAVRRTIGVVFQSPALDKQLTVAENLRYHARLYGLDREKTEVDMMALLGRFGLVERKNEFVQTLSGGMRRKVELAKALLAKPKLLILDEPSTGLDLNARNDLWRLLGELREHHAGLTVLLTTHLMDEADRCDRLAILDNGRVLADSTPDALKDSIGGDVIRFSGHDLPLLAATVADKLGVAAIEIDGKLHIERPSAHLFVPHLIEAAPGLIESVTVGRPTLDDVFVRLTGRGLSHEPAASATV